MSIHYSRHTKLIHIMYREIRYNTYQMKRRNVCMHLRGVNTLNVRYVFYTKIACSVVIRDGTTMLKRGKSTVVCRVDIYALSKRMYKRKYTHQVGKKLRYLELRRNVTTHWILKFWRPTRSSIFHHLQCEMCSDWAPSPSRDEKPRIDIFFNFPSTRCVVLYGS